MPSADLPVPRLLDAYDDGNWVALICEDTQRRHEGVSTLRGGNAGRRTGRIPTRLGHRSTRGKECELERARRWGPARRCLLKGW